MAHWTKKDDEMLARGFRAFERGMEAASSRSANEMLAAANAAVQQAQRGEVVSMDMYISAINANGFVCEENQHLRKRLKAQRENAAHWCLAALFGYGLAGVLGMLWWLTK